MMARIGVPKAEAPRLTLVAPPFPLSTQVYYNQGAHDLALLMIDYQARAEAQPL